MPIQMQYVDSASGAVYPEAFWNADDVRIGLKESYVQVSLGVYVDKAHFDAGTDALTTIIKRFTDVENTTARGLLTTTLYTILATRDEFSSGTLV